MNVDISPPWNCLMAIILKSPGLILWDTIRRMSRDVSNWACHLQKLIVSSQNKKKFSKNWETSIFVRSQLFFRLLGQQRKWQGHFISVRGSGKYRMNSNTSMQKTGILKNSLMLSNVNTNRTQQNFAIAAFIFRYLFEYSWKWCCVCICLHSPDWVFLHSSNICMIFHIFMFIKMILLPMEHYQESNQAMLIVDNRVTIRKGKTQ